MSARHISLSSLHLYAKKFLQFVEIWRSSDKNNFAQFFRNSVAFQCAEFTGKF